MSEDPSMRMGLSISKWGPAAWNTLHVVAHTFPDAPTQKEREDLHSFLKLFGQHLPCPKCRTHFVQLLNERLTGADSVHLQSRERVTAFLNEAHNDVNRRLGKPSFTLEDHYSVYSKQTPYSNTSSSFFLSWPSLVVVLLVLTTYVAFFRRRREVTFS